MKLLCVVNHFLQKILTEGFRGMTLTFCVQWDEAAHALAQSRFDMVIIHGEAVEDEVLPILLWSAASQLRLLGTKGIFVGLSVEGGKILSQYYPTMKQIVYPSSAPEFFLDMQQVEPAMFTDSTISRTGSSGLKHQRLVLKRLEQIAELLFGKDFRLLLLELWQGNTLTFCGIDADQTEIVGAFHQRANHCIVTANSRGRELSGLSVEVCVAL